MGRHIGGKRENFLRAMNNEGGKLIVDKLDCIGEPCPLPLMKVEEKIESLAAGEELVIEVDHTCAMTNVPEWARKQGYKVETREVNFGEWEIKIIKNE